MDYYGICPWSYIPVWKHADPTSEIFSQVLWGDMFGILGSKNGFLHIELKHDGHRGWINEAQALRITKEYYQQRTFEIIGHVPNTRSKVLLDDDTYIDLPFGAQLSLSEWESKRVLWKGMEGKIVGTGSYEKLPEASEETEKITYYQKYLPQAPHIPGGRTQWGWDAAGFTQGLFRVCGIPYLERSPLRQSLQGRAVPPKETKLGDLIFFEADDKVVHVGVVLPDQKVWHCLHQLKVDHISEEYLTDETEKKLFKVHSARSFF